MKKALVVGINYYKYLNPLFGCVDDANAVSTVLEKNWDGTRNFDVQLLLSTGSSNPILRAELRSQIRELFAGENNTALLYFAGHGHIEPTGGYVLDSESQEGNDGIPLAEVLTFANNSAAKNRIIVLDSCYSGSAAANSHTSSVSELSEGLTILTASTADQYANEENNAGVFTSLFVDALNGAAANLLGDVTPGSVYAHIDQSLGAWDQRPVFKTNVKNFVSLRRVKPPIDLVELQQISELFPTRGYIFNLDPSFEPERNGTEVNILPPDPINTAKFAILQKYNRVNLVVPLNAPHMWHAAMNSKSCKLTVLGEHYRKLVVEGRI